MQQDDDAYCMGFTAGDASSYDPLANPAPAAGVNTLTVASMNTWNFFDTTDDAHKSDDMPTQAEYDQKSLKRAEAICSPDGLNRPLIVGLHEVENDTVLQKLAGDVAALCGVDYDVHTLAGPDNRSIEVSFLTRADRVKVLAVNDRQGCSATNWSIDYETGDHLPDVTCTGNTPYYLFNRPPLHLEAVVNLGGVDYTLHIINNYFKSKLSSSSCSEPDCTDRRVEQAQHVDNLVDDLLVADPNALILVMGNLNDYYNSQPLDVLDQTAGVLNALWDDLQGPPSSGQGTITRYSYIYNGVAQTLDHMLVSDGLHAEVRTVSPRHLNADWPASHLNDSSMYRSSDHDFLLVGFTFGDTTPTTTPTSAPPTSTPTPTATSTPLPTATNTPPRTNTPAPASTMHVADLDASKGNNGSTWTAYVTIHVEDNTGAPVANAIVSGSWSNGPAASCTTDGDGTCTVSQSGILKKNGTVTYSVSGISHDSLAYTAAANTDPDGDSDGTSITVSK